MQQQLQLLQGSCCFKLCSFLLMMAVLQSKSCWALKMQEEETTTVDLNECVYVYFEVMMACGGLGVS